MARSAMCAPPKGATSNKPAITGNGFMKTVTIFGSSLPGEETTIYREARRVGKFVAECGLTLCNGGYAGLMEASSRGAREVGGHTVGVTCSIWPAPANRWVVEEVRTHSFSQRIITLIERGDAYVVLPGGTGTLAELALTWEMMNKSTLSRTVGGRKPLLVMEPYWRPVIDCLDQEPALASPTADRHAAAMDLITLVSSADQAADYLRRWCMHSVPKGRLFRVLPGKEESEVG